MVDAFSSTKLCFAQFYWTFKDAPIKQCQFNRNYVFIWASWLDKCCFQKVHIRSRTLSILGCRVNCLDEPIFVAALLYRMTRLVYLEEKTTRPEFNWNIVYSGTTCSSPSLEDWRFASFTCEVSVADWWFRSTVSIQLSSETLQYTVV